MPDKQDNKQHIVRECHSVKHYNYIFNTKTDEIQEFKDYENFYSSVNETFKKPPKLFIKQTSDDHYQICSSPLLN
jgi:hypothetical protein